MILAELRSTGLTVTANADKLCVEPASTLTDAQRAMIRRHKAGILRELEAEASDTRATIKKAIEVANLAEFRAALRAGDLHLCGNCSRFTFAADPAGPGTCSKFGGGLAPFAMPFWCPGFEKSPNPVAPEFSPPRGPSVHK